MFITSGLFIFGMAAVKQMLAMGIGLWFIDSYLSKKNIKSIRKFNSAQNIANLVVDELTYNK